MKPFSIFLHRFKPEIVHIEYPHLCIRNNEKRKLTLYPQIIVKSKDLGLEQDKQRFQILMGQSRQIKNQQLREMNVQRAVVVDKDDSELNKYINDSLSG